MILIARRIILIAVLLVFISLSSCQRHEHPNVILITIDTLRADHLSLYGYARNTSPNVDGFARDGLWFRNCYSQSSTTFASHVSLFTGRYPGSNGVIANRGDFP